MMWAEVVEQEDTTDAEDIVPALAEASYEAHAV